MYEGENGNTIDPLYETETDEGDGVKVIVPVSFSDRHDFLNKIKEQLAYFEDVYYDIFTGMSNDFKIHRGSEFQYSENTSDNSLHICLDNVYYPIDFGKMNIPRIEAPIGLRFSLSDGLFPTPNRESLRYTSEAKATILSKIKLVAEYFIDKYNESITDTKSLDDIFKYYNFKEKYVSICDDIGKNFDVRTFLPFSTKALIKPKLEEITLLDLERVVDNKDKLLGEYKIKFEASFYRIKELNKRKSSDVTVSNLNNSSKKYYLYNIPMSFLKKEYLKSTLNGYDTVYLVKKVSKYNLGLRAEYFEVENYMKILKLKKYPREEWRTMIKEYQFVQSLLISKFINVDEIEVSQEWLDSRKRQRLSISQGGNRRVKLQGEFSCKVAQPLERYVQGRSCKFVATTLKYENLHNIGALIIYDTHDNNDKLDNLYNIVGSLGKIRCITFSEREISNLEKLKIHNLISYKKFMEGDNKPFKRLVTAYKIKKLMDEYPAVFNKTFHLKTVSKDLIEKIRLLANYEALNYKRSDSTLYDAMLTVAEEHSLFDQEIYHIYTNVNDFLKKLPFINILLGSMDRYERDVENNEDKALISILCDMLKYYKIRIDYTNYNITLNDTTWMDEILTDETVDNLLEDGSEVESVIEEEEV